MSYHDSPPNEKAEAAHDDFGELKISAPQHHRHHHGHAKTEEEIARIDAIALAQGTTMESFKHLDEKKILRKV